MKLVKIIRLNESWDTKSEAQLLADVSMNGYLIRNITNPSEAVQAVAIRENPLSVGLIKNPSQKVVLTALKDERFINHPIHYNFFVKRHFANNTLLMKKWLRYCETMRNTNEA
ncbi:hypothetical protein M0R04_07715 [Candidatus Dojkabacteria bacterium]|jgi:hypothetical protein|nr:hypothetical protein [Candidatus Dojkabacteria bacterium]